MKKILILANNDVGLYKFRKELIEELLKNYIVILSLPYGKYIDNLKDLGCIFIQTNMDRRGTNPIKDIILLIKYYFILKNIKPDIVLSYTIKPNIYGGLLCGLFNVPYISNITGLGTVFEKKSLLSKFAIFLYKYSLHNARCIFFQNNDDMNFLILNKVVNSKYRLIPGSGVNAIQYKLLEYPKNEEINFMFISRIMEQKGIEQYLETAIYVKQRYKNVNFHILGNCEENYEDKLQSLHNKGIINYHGMQENVVDFHKISHCTIHPTYYPEGMSNVLLESASCGRPIITTNRSGCKEIVEDNITGYLVKQKDTLDLIEKVEKFILLDFEDKKQMGINGRLKIEKEFNRQIVIEAYIDEINKAIG